MSDGPNIVYRIYGDGEKKRLDMIVNGGVVKLKPRKSDLEREPGYYDKSWSFLGAEQPKTED